MSYRKYLQHRLAGGEDEKLQQKCGTAHLIDCVIRLMKMPVFTIGYRFEFQPIRIENNDGGAMLEINQPVLLKKIDGEWQEDNNLKAWEYCAENKEQKQNDLKDIKYTTPSFIDPTWRYYDNEGFQYNCICDKPQVFAITLDLSHYLAYKFGHVSVMLGRIYCEECGVDDTQHDDSHNINLKNNTRKHTMKCELIYHETCKRYDVPQLTDCILNDAKIILMQHFNSRTEFTDTMNPLCHNNINAKMLFNDQRDDESCCFHVTSKLLLHQYPRIFFDAWFTSPDMKGIFGYPQGKLLEKFKQRIDSSEFYKNLNYVEMGKYILANDLVQHIVEIAREFCGGEFFTSIHDDKYNDDEIANIKSWPKADTPAICDNRDNTQTDTHNKKLHKLKTKESYDEKSVKRVTNQFKILENTLGDKDANNDIDHYEKCNKHLSARNSLWKVSDKCCSNKKLDRTHHCVKRVCRDQQCFNALCQFATDVFNQHHQSVTSRQRMMLQQMQLICFQFYLMEDVCLQCFVYALTDFLMKNEGNDLCITTLRILHHNIGRNKRGGEQEREQTLILQDALCKAINATNVKIRECMGAILNF